ncbi:hypothetical protein [Sphingomonas sp. PAMC 26621]|uniref:hypothetical protein n=1 Tax=Sphingomonas sp. PAMC 26621 TaxID=1112213 RepID=UPI000474B173|nr:hypothetical protein [Sphingomonas sp. PAMC 26621]
MKCTPWLGAILIATAQPALASNTLITAQTPVAVAKSPMTVTPDREWNKMGARPGRNSESWTIDGDGLNEVTFYGGIEPDRALFREVNKHATPLPRFSSTMLLTDLPALFEASYRIALNTPVMKIDAVRPATFLGQKGVQFSYTYSRVDEEVRRRGDAVAAIIGGKLFMITFDAPDVFYYQRDIAAYRAIVAKATIAR